MRVRNCVLIHISSTNTRSLSNYNTTDEDATGTSALMFVAGRGEARLVALLLQYGAPWNAIDRKGRCAGEYALENKHQRLWISW